VTIVAQSNQKQVEALSEVSDIIVQISDEDLGRMESLAQQIARFDQQLGDRITEAYMLLTQLNDDVETALEHLEPDVEEEDEEIDVDEDNVATIDEDEDLEEAEAEAVETDADDEEDEGKGKGKGRSKRKK
jgi:phage host-nuclease inhibitor protein Gam